MALPYSLVSRDAQIALTEFSQQFDMAMAAATAIPWAEQLGLVNSSKAIKTTYPIPISAAGYHLRKGDDVMRSLYERSLSMRIREWVDGVAEKASIIEAPDFIGWAGEPSRIALEGARQPNLIVAEMLHANPMLDLYRVEHEGGSVASNIHFFEASGGNNGHPVNIFDTAKGKYYNDYTYVVNSIADWSAMFKAVKTRFRQKKAPNGRVMGLQFTHLLCPAALEEEAHEFLASDNVVRALAVSNKAGSENVAAVPNWTNNVYKNSVELIVAPELLDDNVMYAIDGTSGRYPWILQNGGAPEEILYTKLDQLYKDTGKVGVKYVLQMATAAAIPIAIERLTINRS